MFYFLVWLERSHAVNLLRLSILNLQIYHNWRKFIHLYIQKMLSHCSNKILLFFLFLAILATFFLSSVLAFWQFQKNINFVMNAGKIHKISLMKTFNFIFLEERYLVIQHKFWILFLFYVHCQDLCQHCICLTFEKKYHSSWAHDISIFDTLFFRPNKNFSDNRFSEWW